MRCGGWAIGLCLWLVASPAYALLTDARAFRLEDKREGHLVVGADQAEIEAGEVYRNVVLLWGNLRIAGKVDEVVVVSGQVTFLPGSQLEKSLVVMGGGFTSEPGARVAPESVAYRSPGPLWRTFKSVAALWQRNLDWITRLAGVVFFLLLSWGIGLGLVRAFPRLALIPPRLSTEWAENLVVSFLGIIFAPAILALLVLSVVGVLALPFYFLLLAVLGYLSYLMAAAWAGQRLLPPRAGEKMRPVGFLLGLVILQIFWLIGSWASYLAVTLIWALGWGALVRNLRERK